MTTLSNWGLKALTTSIICVVFAVSANAEQAPAATTAPQAGSAKVVAPTATKPAPAAPATATAKPATTAKKAVTVSPCKGLDQKACGGNKACAWIVPKDVNDKTGKLQEPYCRKVAGVALKKPAAQPAAVAKTTAPPVVVTPTANAANTVAAASKKSATKVVTPAGTTAASKVAPPAPATAQ